MNAPATGSEMRETEENFPLLSIITACLNPGDSLSKCIESVSRQNFSNYEHIIIDGGSNDGTVELLKQLASQNLKWSSGPDTGIAQAMNSGIERSRGRYLLFLHADDHLLPDLEWNSLLNELTGDHTIYCHDTIIRRNGKSIIWKARPQRIWRKMPGSHQGMIIPRSAFSSIGTYDESYRIAMDYDWVFRAAQQGFTFKAAPSIISEASGHGISGQKNWPEVKDRLLQEKQIHMKHSEGFKRTLYKFYWFMYLRYRKYFHLFYQK